MRGAPMYVALLTSLIATAAQAETPADAPPPASPPAEAPPSEANAPPARSSASKPTRREPTAGDLATARTALREGLVLRDKGELEDALARLASAYDLVPTPVTGFELGKTHMMLGNVLQAHELFKKVVRMAPSMEESTRSETSRLEAARLAAELEPRIPSLHVKLTLPPGASAVVKIDDEEISMTSPETVRAVDPGPHDVVAKAGDGPEERVHVEIAEAETKEVALAPQWIPPKDPEPGKTTQIIYVRQTNPLAFVGFGVAAAALVVTTVAAFIYIDARDDARNGCGVDFCPPAPSRGVLPSNAVADTNFNSDHTRYQVSGLVALAAGFTTAAFVGLGVLGVASPIKERVVTQRGMRPTVGLGRLGVAGTF